MIIYSMMTHDGHEVASYGTSIEGYAERGMKLCKTYKDTSSKFCKDGDEFCVLMNEKIGKDQYSFLAFMNGLEAKEFAFDMINKLAKHFMQSIEQNNKELTSEMTLHMSKKIKEFIVRVFVG